MNPFFCACRAQLAAAAAAAAAATAGLELAAAASATANVASGPLTMQSGVQGLLAECYASGACRPGELDDRVLQGLAALREADGIAALKKFMRSDMSKIRNKSAYFSGVISRFKEETGGGGGRHGALKSPNTVNGAHFGQVLSSPGYGANAGAFGGAAHFGSHFSASGPHAAAANYAAASAAAAAAATVSAQQQQQHANMLMAQAAAHQQHAAQQQQLAAQQQQLLLLGGGGALPGGVPRVGMQGLVGVAGFGAPGVASLPAVQQPPGNTAALPLGVQTTLEQLYVRGVQRWELDQKCVGV